MFFLHSALTREVSYKMERCSDDLNRAKHNEDVFYLATCENFKIRSKGKFTIMTTVQYVSMHIVVFIHFLIFCLQCLFSDSEGVFISRFHNGRLSD